MSQQDSHGLTRRKIIASLGAGTAASIAGCGEDGSGNGNGNGGGNGNGSAELGERVGTVVQELFNFQPYERFAPIAEDNVEQLGISVENEVFDVITRFNKVQQDTQEQGTLFMWGHSQSPDRLDPAEFTNRHGADWSGAGGKQDVTMYTDCLFTSLAHGSSRAASEEDRRELTYRAHELLSDALVVCPFTNIVNSSIVRSDRVDVVGAGTAGFNTGNPDSIIRSEATEGDRMRLPIPSRYIERLNYPTLGEAQGTALWSQTVTSPLTGYNGDYELQNVLAENIEVEDEFQTITVTLKDAVAHNGDPLTSEDVKFSFKFYWDNQENIPLITPAPYESIETPDDKTVVFNFEESFPVFVTKTASRWGILHKETWEEVGAYEDPAGASWDDPSDMIGFGPYTISSFQGGVSWTLDPFEDHVMYEPETGLSFQAFDNQQPETNAFRAGEIDATLQVTPTVVDRIIEQVDAETEEYPTKWVYPYYFGLQFHMAPTKFRPFRKAVGAALNRQRMNQVALAGRGDVETKSSIFMQNHPFRPPDEFLTEFTDDPSGDIEAARQALSDAGWGWDNNGNLHYPPGADLSPLWPPESNPSPDDFPCLNENGEYVGDPITSMEEYEERTS